MDRDLLLADLNRDEEFVPYIYDDGAGPQARVIPGYKMIGNATLCTGWCPAKNPCTPDLNATITGYWADKTWASLAATAPWVSTLTEPRQRALCEMAFNLGVHGLMTFNTFLSLMQSGQYEAAAQDLETGTAWWKQVGERGPRIQALIKGETV